MKKLLTLVIALTLVLTSCSSDDDSAATPVLVTQIIENHEYNGNIETFTYTYSYDGNKLLGFVVGNSSSVVTYTNDLITKIESFHDNELVGERIYTYDSSDRLINFKRFEYSSSSYENDYGVNVDYVYNSNGTVSYTKESGNLPNLSPSSTGVISFTSSGGPVSSVEASTGYTYSYTYDTKNNPMKNVLGANKLIFEDDGSGVGSLHNALSKVEQNSTNTYTVNYTYTYNNNDYPTQSTQNDGYSTVTKQYTYNQ